MKAIIYTNYGPPEMLHPGDVPKPIPKDNEVLIKVHSVSLNASDMEFLTAKPAYVRMWGPLKPKYNILGSDISGVVESVGKNVTDFKPGDPVFGDNFNHWGGLAEFVCIPEKMVLRKPDSLTFEEAASLPQAGVVALQGLQFNGDIQKGTTLLINGAGGGAGTFAIQLAKHYGANVTGVDNGQKQDIMKKVGADHVIDYKSEDFRKGTKRYDLILDLICYRSIFDNKRALSTNGTYVMVGGSWPRIFQVLLLGSLISKFSSKKMGMLIHKQNREDMKKMINFHEANTLHPIIDKVFPLSETAAAFQYMADGKAKGKIIITI